MPTTIKKLTTFFACATAANAFTPKPLTNPIRSESSKTALNIFGEAFEKAFEEEGPLGKGITVGKIQIALSLSGPERTSKDSILSLLENSARNSEDTLGYDDDYEDGYGDSHLSQMCHKTCLALMRKSDDWIGACSESKWFKGEDGAKAESLFNQWADREAAKFEKEYIPDESSSSTESSPTIAVISLILEIQGDSTNFSRAGFSISETKEVLASIASDCRVEGGDCLNAVEVFWTPSDLGEVLTERDTVLDFPELISF
eukprot:CCRYP_000192-RA/>CCRYP_000192-RA protein AED:0.01 eAED:0.01 QI:110/1/1/1/1/1/2/1165/258